MAEDGAVGEGDGLDGALTLVAVHALLKGVEEEAELGDDGDDEGGVIEARRVEAVAQSVDVAAGCTGAGPAAASCHEVRVGDEGERSQRCLAYVEHMC